MMWNKEVDFAGLKIYVSACGIFTKTTGPVFGFFVNDKATIQAINENDPRVLEAVKWMVSEDAQDFCKAQSVKEWINTGGKYDDDYEEKLNRLLVNKYINESTREYIKEELAKLTQRAIKKHYTQRRRSDFQQKRDGLMLTLIERDGYKCAQCGAYEGLTVDHIIPISKGGSDDLSNLQLMCKSHNSQKGDRVVTHSH